MATVRIRVVASADSSLANVFVPLSKAAENARKKVGEEMAAGAKAAAHPYASQLPKATKAAFDAMTAEAKKAAKGMEPIAAQAKSTGLALGHMADGAKEKFAALAAGLKSLTPDLKVVAQEAQRELAKLERQQARAALGLGGGPKRSGGFGSAFNSAAGWTLGIAGRVASGALSFGSRVAGDLVRGIGVNTDLASMFNEQKTLEARSVELSNSGYMPSDETGRNRRRVDPAELVRQARQVGINTGMSAGDAMGGLQSFVGKTGDLATGRAVLEDLARLSKATGTNLEDMVSAAGDVSTALGDVPDKGKAIYDVMKGVAGQGKTGAVEIKDLANQMAKIASVATQFSGDRAHNIAILGALAQESRQRGGSASATQAATSVSSFVNTFSKSARLGNFKGFGVDVQGATGLRDAQSIIIDSLNAAMRGGMKAGAGGKMHAVGGGMANFNENMGAMFADVRARSSVRGFESIYRETYANTSGGDQERMAAATKAVTDEFDRLTSTAMTEEEVQKSFQKAMSTADSKVNSFNGVISSTAADIGTMLLPALLDLAPVAINLAQGFKDMVGWLVKMGIIKDVAKEQKFTEAHDIVEAGRKAVEASDKVPTRTLISGEKVPLSSVHVSPEAAEGVSDARASLERMLDEANKRRTDLRDRYGAFARQPEDELQKVAQNKWDPAHFAANAVLTAENDVSKAEKELDMAKAVEQGMKAALGSGRLSVVVEEDRTNRPQASPHAQMDADSK